MLSEIEANSTATSQCGQQTTCESCYDSSYLCHWCKNIPPSPFFAEAGSCHEKLSPYGCQVGDSCGSDDCSERKTCSSCMMGGCKFCASSSACVSPYSWACALPSNCLPNSECERTEPEFIGYENGIPSWVAWCLSVGYLGLVIMSFVLAYICRPVSGYERIDGERTWPRFMYRLGVLVWGLTLLVIGGLLLLVGVYWPTPPDVSMCNVELMWRDTLNMLINTITTGKTTIESEVLITVYNPNRLGLRINSVNGNIYYKAAPIGTLDVKAIEIVPGSAMDSLGVVTFNGFENIAEMYYDFNVEHKLLLSFELFVNFSIREHVLSAGVPRFQINVNDPPPQKYCNCTTLSSFVYSSLS